MLTKSESNEPDVVVVTVVYASTLRKGGFE